MKKQKMKDYCPKTDLNFEMKNASIANQSYRKTKDQLLSLLHSTYTVPREFCDLANEFGQQDGNIVSSLFLKMTCLTVCFIHRKLSIEPNTGLFFTDMNSYLTFSLGHAGFIMQTENGAV